MKRPFGRLLNAIRRMHRWAFLGASCAGIAMAAGVVGPAEAQSLRLCKNPGGTLFALPVCPSGFTAVTAGQIGGLQGPAGPAGPVGATGPAGPAGPVGPSGPSVIASFTGSGPLIGGAGLVFGKVLERAVGPGSYVAIATVSNVSVGAGSFGGEEHKSLATDCQLRNFAGGVIGSSGASGSFTEFVRDTNEITVIGGDFVAEGANGLISLWCRSAFSERFEIAGAQLMVLKIGGFAR